MAIEFKCPSCGAGIEADESVAGSQAQCPNCHGTMLVPRQGIRPGLTVGTYLIERKLGVGGMGEVWLAKHTAMQREVALKILSPAMTNDPEFVTRFMHEVQTAAKLEHPNMVTAFDAGEAGDIHYLAVSYVDGEEVGKLLKRETVIPEREALRIVRGVAEALAYAWNKFRMLHRDIKPANIILTADGTPKLMDMGISKTMSENVQLTMTGYILGTPDYMSPEQARGDEGVDFHSDMYALGATLYHMVAGSVPFGGTTMMAVLTRHITEPLESPRKRNPRVSEACAALIEAMMAKEAKDRPVSWESVIRDIDLVMNGRMPASRRPATGNSVVTRMTVEELRSMRTGQRKAVPAQSLQAALHRPSPPPPAKSSLSAPALVTAGVLAAVAVVGLTVFMARPAPPPTPVPQVAPSPVATPTRPVREADKTAEMWDYAVKYTGDHPQQYDVAIENFQTLKMRAAGTKYELMADAEIKRLEEAQRDYQDKAITQVLDDLKAKAKPLADGQDFAGAAEVYKSYTGPLAKETDAERIRLAANITRQGQQLAENRTKSAEAAKQKVDAALASVAAGLLEGKTAELRSLVEPLSKEDMPSTEQERVQKVQALLHGLGQVDDLVLKSFEAQTGQDVDVPLAGKMQRLKILGVRVGVVQAERVFEQAVVGVEFTPKQLPVEERCRRLGGRAPAELCALYAGLASHARGGDQTAARTVGGAGVLAPALQAALGSELAARQQAQKEIAARQALIKVLQSWGGVGDDLAWPAVSNRLEKLKWTESTAKAAQSGLESFLKEYGETPFAVSQLKLFEQVALLLESKAQPSEAPAVAQDPRLPATIGGKSPYRRPAELKAAIKLENPGYTNKIDVVVEKGQIVDIAFAEWIGTTLTNIAPLKGIPLRKLELTGAVKLIDFSPLKGMPLESLSLRGCPGFGDDSAPLLATMPLTYLALDSAKLSDLSVLKGKRLTDLTISGSVTGDLGPLRGMPLEYLSLFYMSSVKDFSAISSLHSLKHLNLQGTPCTDFSFFKGIKIEYLKFDPKDLKNPEDVRLLRNMKSLKEVNVVTGDKHYSAAEFWKRNDAGEFGNP